MATTGPDHDIALAAQHDVAGILDLQQRNLAKRGGGLSVPFARTWFEAAIADGQVIVARRDNSVVGYLVFSNFAAQAHVPLVQAMLAAYPGAPDAYNYGPVCVAESERGRGVAAAMFAAMQARLPGREAVAFIRRDNPVSLTAHIRMGMREVAEFTHGGVDFAVVASSGRPVA